MDAIFSSDQCLKSNEESLIGLRNSKSQENLNSTMLDLSTGSVDGSRKINVKLAKIGTEEIL